MLQRLILGNLIIKQRCTSVVAARVFRFRQHEAS
jgi:hypothetical protein